jgi:hypothetical protein
MTAGPMCVAYGVERHAIAIEPVNARYEIRSDECPRCKTVVRLVNARRATTGKRKLAETRGFRALKPIDWSEKEISPARRNGWSEDHRRGDSKTPRSSCWLSAT